MKSTLKIKKRILKNGLLFVLVLFICLTMYECKQMKTAIQQQENIVAKYKEDNTNLNSKINSLENTYTELQKRCGNLEGSINEIKN